jgi:hypothetical protein
MWMVYVLVHHPCHNKLGWHTGTYANHDPAKSSGAKAPDLQYYIRRKRPITLPAMAKPGVFLSTMIGP